MTEKKVSVVLTSYNHAKYLREAIESVLNQIFTDFEFMIWDDGSTDESWSIIQSYTDSRIRALRNETGKSGWSFRKAILAIGDAPYVAIHHSDDIWEPQKLEKQVSFIESHPEIGAVFSQVNFIGENSQPFIDNSRTNYNIFNHSNRNRHAWLNYFFYQGNALCHPSVLIRKQCYDDCGYYRQGFTQIGDMDMWVRLCLKYEIHILPEKLIKYRIRSNEMNLGGNRPETRTRREFEYLQLLSNYRKITSLAEFLKIFPNAKKFQTAEGIDLDFALGMLALEAGPYRSRELFGLTILFECLNNPVKANKLTELYGFDHTDFIALTVKHDTFSFQQIASLNKQLLEKDSHSILKKTLQLTVKFMLNLGLALPETIRTRIRKNPLIRSGIKRLKQLIRQE